MYTTKKRILSFRLRAKARGDTKDVRYLTKNSQVLATTNCLDKGYDSNPIHAHFRDKGVYSIIPIRNNGKRGQYRKEMKNYFDHAQYWQRNCAEYNNSSLKRRFGDYVRSVKFCAQHAEVTARIIIHNLKSFLLRLFHQSRYFVLFVSKRHKFQGKVCFGFLLIRKGQLLSKYCCPFLCSEKI